MHSLANSIRNIFSEYQKGCPEYLYSLKPGASEFTISGLDECAMYLIHVIPADETGQIYPSGFVNLQLSVLVDNIRKN